LLQALLIVALMDGEVKPVELRIISRRLAIDVSRFHRAWPAPRGARAARAKREIASGFR